LYAELSFALESITILVICKAFLLTLDFCFLY
jgi:hypothetical protein